jgi:transglutaminase-like putative cysteine protease
MHRIAALLLTALFPIVAHAQEPAQVQKQPTPVVEPTNSFSFVRYLADYEVKADATSVETNEYEILIKTKAGVDQWSQVRLSYSEKMDTLEVLAAYTLTPDGTRHDVPADKIYTQESYSSASAAMYADRKVKVIVFPNLSPGTRLVYRYRQSQNTPYFPGYFGLWETLSLFTQYDDARITLTAPKDLPMHVYSRDVKGSDQPRIDGDRARWSWSYTREQPMKNQNWTAAAWEYSPTIMASTYADFSAMGRAYQVKGAEAAKVTPAVQARADAITAGVTDRRQQAAAIYEWVAKNIRYVAVYLGNGGLEPNAADSILGNRYGDCKDHTVVLEALLAAEGIASTTVLIGANGGPTLPQVAVLGRFNHAITYVPEFDLYLDSTSPYARFGQLPASDLGAPVVHAVDGRIARTPANGPSVSAYRADSTYTFSANGDVSGRTVHDSGASGEIGLRAAFSQLTSQNRARIEESIMAASGFNGQGRLELQGDVDDLSRPFGYTFDFRASDYADFSVVGGMTLPDPPGAESMRGVHTSTSSETNAVPFYCNDSLREESYTLTFPASVPIIAVPRDSRFKNPAGEYQAAWKREGQQVTATHRLSLNAIHGAQNLCQPADYPAFRELYQYVRRGFRGQIVYGDLSRAQVSKVE